MSILTGKPIVLVVLGLLLSLCPAGSAAEAADKKEEKAKTLVWEDDFEERLPGQLPKGWSRYWGEQGDDQALVSNINVLEGKRCLLLDRRTGTNKSQWGLCRPFPDIPKGRAVLEIPFLIHGKGNDVRFCFDIRGEKTINEHLILFSFWEKRLSFSAKMAEGKKFGRGIVLGENVHDHWHKLVIHLVARDSGKGGGKLKVALYKKDGKGWKLVKLAEKDGVVPPRKRYGLIMLNTLPYKRNYLVYLDHLRLYKTPRQE
ncbi:MAG: hypothetical protein K9N51_12855 [Candidatus Pacebacteria bacterium]|nr:hypothetical protein [Candidatus Paceibacterota bacterium]